MGYGIIPVIAVVALALHHVVLGDASQRSKVFISIVVAVSLVVWVYYPRWLILATLVQVAVSFYLLVRLRIQEAARR